MKKSELLGWINLDPHAQCFLIALREAGGPVDQFSLGVIAGIVGTMRAPAEPGFPGLPGVQRAARG